MNSERYRSRQLGAKRFVDLVGAEYELLSQSGSASMSRFVFSTVFIFVISLLTIASVWYAMELLFHMIYVEWLMAVFISGLFIVIYIFLINTFSKQVEQSNVNAKNSWKDQINASNIIRTSFVVFIGFLIAQPAGVWVFRVDLEKEVNMYKATLNNEHHRKLDALYDEQISVLDIQIDRYQGMLALFKAKSAENHIGELKTSKLILLEKKAIDQQLTTNKISRSDFFLHRVKLASRNPLCWLIWLCIVIVFLVPGYLIYSIGAEDAYFRLRRERDHNLIQQQYDVFEEKYHSLFQHHFAVEVLYYSRYIDPPFYSALKVREEAAEQKLFIEKFKRDTKTA